VTSLLKTIESMKRDRVTVAGVLGGREGKDFLFLFDLLAHTCGLESTLRVLTHSDEKFYEICKPNMEPREQHILLEEDKVLSEFHFLNGVL
jgi:thiamine pyrophosphokinase